MAKNVVIVGGGIMGSATAYFLRTLSPDVNVTVFERDPAYEKASSALSAGGIRQQFSTALNCQMSLFGISFLRDLGKLLEVDGDRPDIGLTEGGYLYLCTAADEAVLRSRYELQRSQGADVRFMSPGELKDFFPWLATDDLAAGVYGQSGEGWYDGYGLMRALRRKAIALGARYLPEEVTAITVRGGAVEAVNTAQGTKLSCDVLVNAAGPWARQVSELMGVALPVRARRRPIFMFETPAKLPRCPLLIDPSGPYFRPEGKNFIVGYSPDAAHDPDDLPLEVDYSAFDEILWPTLAQRVPALESLKMLKAWAGYYEYNTVDQNAVIGLHPALRNAYFANGFSGHGLQHGPATGRGLAELIVHGRYQTLDLSPLGWDRLLSSRPNVEANIV